MSLLLALQNAAEEEAAPSGGAPKKRRRVSWPEKPVDLYELFKVEQNNTAIIAALELT